jgi:hypothetical protein
LRKAISHSFRIVAPEIQFKGAIHVQITSLSSAMSLDNSLGTNLGNLITVYLETNSLVLRILTINNILSIYHAEFYSAGE